MRWEKYIWCDLDSILVDCAWHICVTKEGYGKPCPACELEAMYEGRPDYLVAGGREVCVYRIPEGYVPLYLTARMRDTAEYLFGDECIIPTTGHGKWKCRMHQGYILVREEYYDTIERILEEETYGRPLR